MSAIRLFDKFQKLLDVTWGSIADGQTLKRSGANIIGYTPGGGSGDVVGPAGAVSGRIASYADTTGKLIADGGKLATDVVTGPASATGGNIATYNGTTGKIIQDGAKLATDLVTGPVSVTTGNIASYNGTTGKIIQDGAKLATDLVIGPASSVDSEVALFSGTGGKTIKRAAGTGAVTVVNGVYQTPAGVLDRGALNGLVTANNGSDLVNDVDIGTGECRNDIDTDDLVLTSALTKRLDANWVVGTNQGGLDTGTVGNNCYHLWLIKRTDTGVVDALFSLSATAPTMPASYTIKRRIAGFWRTGAAIVRWFQQGDEFWLNTPTVDAAGTSMTANVAILPQLTVPTGVRVTANFTVWITKSPAAAFSGLVTCPDCADAAVGTIFDFSCNATYSVVNSVFNIRTNTSGQVRVKVDTTGPTMYVITKGWVDARGRFD